MSVAWISTRPEPILPVRAIQAWTLCRGTSATLDDLPGRPASRRTYTGNRPGQGALGSV
jgi:hypothetical protein